MKSVSLVSKKKISMTDLYWRWRLSSLSKPWYALKTFLFLHLNARATATHLDDCMRAFGQMDHPHQGCKDTDTMNMSVSIRQDLVYRSWKTLPTWRWRND